MNDAANYRHERIKRLLDELQYEVTRGIMQNEIEEEITLRWMIPQSRHFPDGYVACEFKVRPMPRWRMAIGEDWMELEPKLKIVQP